MKKFFFLNIFLFFIYNIVSAADDSGVVSWRHANQDNLHISKTYSLRSTNSHLDGLEYLNNIRKGSGLIPFHSNALLDTAAQKHVDYLIYHNLFSHYEDQANYSYLFSGVDPGERINTTGYNWTAYGENLSAGDNDIYEAIDSLMSAIYHRFGFLTFYNDEVGIGSETSTDYSYRSVYGFNMANQDNWNVTQSLNPKYILWPYDSYQEAQTSFSNTEIPDPVLECDGINGNPISIEFNSAKNSSIIMHSFNLYEENGSEITNVKNPVTVPELNENQFVLFPMDSLSYNSNYKVKFKYIENSILKEIIWNFNTRKHDEKSYEVHTNNTYDVISAQSYLFHLKPENCNVGLTGYSWTKNTTIVERLNYDLFRISATENTTFNFSSGFSFALNIALTDNAINPSNSPELSTDVTEESIAKLYVATFNRAPDNAGLAYWANTGLSLEEIAQSFFDQPETQALYPQNTSNRDFIASVYMNLFNREADSQGWDYWETELDSEQYSKNLFIITIINGAKNSIEYGNDALTLSNKTEVGLAFANAGLNDINDSKNILIGVTDDPSTISLAIENYGL